MAVHEILLQDSGARQREKYESVPLHILHTSILERKYSVVLQPGTKLSVVMVGGTVEEACFGNSK